LWNHITEEDYCCFILKEAYSIFLTLLSCAPKLLQDVLVDAGLSYDKAAVLSVIIRDKVSRWCLILWQCQKLGLHPFKLLGRSCASCFHCSAAIFPIFTK